MINYLERVLKKYDTDALPTKLESQSPLPETADSVQVTDKSDKSDKSTFGSFVSPVLRSLYRFTEKQIIKNFNLYWLRQCYVPRNRYRIMLQELKYLNRLWLKGELLEAQGHFDGKSTRYQERMGALLRKITQRASEIYELLQQEKPALLRGEYYLMPDDYIEKVIAERNELVKEKE